MRQRQDVTPTVRNSPALTAFEKARALRLAAEQIEGDALHMLMYDAREAGASLRDLEALTGVSHATLGRKSLRNNLMPGSDRGGPGPGWDEDSWIAARDVAFAHEPHERYDRGPWRVEWRTDPDGKRTRHVTTLTAGVATAASTVDGPAAAQQRQSNDTEHDLHDHVEVLWGITGAEYEHLVSRGIDGDRARRIATRLARAVLRVVHPEVVRTGDVVATAQEAVIRDVPGAMVLAGLATFNEQSDRDWQADVRSRRARGYYLGAIEA